MLIQVKSRHTPLEKVQKKHPDATILDLSSRGPQPWVKFSPFFPHGGIPVPLHPDLTSQSVEGIWQGLKVFEGHGVDLDKFENTTMKKLKRTVRRFGKCLGHSTPGGLLGYQEARLKIYLPAYTWVLENCLQKELDELTELAEKGPLVFLDYETNGDIYNLAKPLSHAGLVARHLEQKSGQSVSQDNRSGEAS